MKVKTDTKEKFHVITVPGTLLNAQLTDELAECLSPYLQNDGEKNKTKPNNLVVKLTEITSVDKEAAEKLVLLQQQFYENNASFVICELQNPVETYLDEEGLLELMNVTPTESEAWDIIQMEEIEREIFNNEQGD